MPLLKKTTITVTEVVLIQVCLFLPLVVNKNNNNEHVEYHVIFIPFKGQIYSKQGSHVSLLFETWTLALFSHVLVKPKFLLLTLTRQSFDVRRLHKILHELCTFLTRFSYTLFTKTLLLFCISLLKRFIYRTVNTSKILHSAAIPVTLTMK